MLFIITALGLHLLDFTSNYVINNVVNLFSKLIAFHLGFILLLLRIANSGFFKIETFYFIKRQYPGCRWKRGWKRWSNYNNYGLPKPSLYPEYVIHISSKLLSLCRFSSGLFEDSTITCASSSWTTEGHHLALEGIASECVFFSLNIYS